MCSGFRLERQCECLAIAGLAGSRKEARRAGALPECSRIEGLTRGRRRQRWMGERTRVVVMSRAQANCCRLLSTSLCKSTEVHGTGGRESVALCGDGCLLAPHGCKRWSRARFLSRVPRSPLCFSCAHRRVAVARAMVREAKRQQRRRQSVPGWWEGADTMKRGATAPKSRFSLDPRAPQRLL